MVQKPYSFQATIALYRGHTLWHYVSLPADIAEKIRNHCIARHLNGEHVPVEVTIDRVSWRTKLFEDKKSKSYMLPLKAHGNDSTLRIGESLDVKLRMTV
jgi:hypothetical protein